MRYSVKLILCLGFVPLLLACSDDRATMEIDSAQHNLTLIRETSMPWDNTAKYTIVASRMPDCMRRHEMPEKAKDMHLEIFSPGNNAWILRNTKNGHMFVVETRTCEGFAKLDKEPENGLGTRMGVFGMKNDALEFTRDAGAVAN